MDTSKINAFSTNSIIKKTLFPAVNVNPLDNKFKEKGIDVLNQMQQVSINERAGLAAMKNGNLTYLIQSSGIQRSVQNYTELPLYKKRSSRGNKVDSTNRRNYYIESFPNIKPNKLAKINVDDVEKASTLQEFLSLYDLEDNEIEKLTNKLTTSECKNAEKFLDTKILGNLKEAVKSLLKYDVVPDINNLVNVMHYVECNSDFLVPFSNEVILADLLDKGIISVDVINGEKGILGKNAFSNKFRKISSNAKMFNKITGISIAAQKRAGRMINLGGNISATALKNVPKADKRYQELMQTILFDIENSQNRQLKYRVNLMDFALMNDDTYQKSFDFIKRFSDIRNLVQELNVEPKVDILQNTGELVVKTTVSFVNEDGIKVTLIQTIKEDGTTTVQRTEASGSVTKSWYIGGNSEYINDTDIDIKTDSESSQNILGLQLEIILNEDTKEPEKVIRREICPEIGVYEITEYNLSDYPEDYDIVSHIRDCTIMGGKKLSYVTNNPDGSLKYIENMDVNGYSIQRNFLLGRNKIDNSYSYKIVDKEGNAILNLSREFKQISPNETKTVINGEKYIAFFDDKSKKITIINADGNERTILMKSKIKNNEDLWDACKQIPADVICDIDTYIKKWKYTDKLSNAEVLSGSGKLVSTPDISTIAHEIGHCIDCDFDISNDKTLIEIYDREFNALNSKYTKESAQKYLAYFSPTGGSGGTGLEEFIAETNALLTTGIERNCNCCTRMQFLAQNFPETVAYIGQKLGLSA